MNHDELARLLLDLLIVLGAGFVAGVACKRWGVSLLVGYLVVGTLIGEGGLHLVRDQREDLELLANTGALLLLFAVGLEFSLDELRRLLRFFLVGGAIQMALVAVPLTVAAYWAGLPLAGALLAGAAGALSSTVLVFKALSECGQSATEHGRRALGILLFQDVALVPLLLLVPLLTGSGGAPSVGDIAWLVLKSALFLAAVGALRMAIARWVMPQLMRLRSVELVVLFALGVLTSLGLLAVRLELPAAIGALAAGLVLGGQRITRQIDTILLPFRESFSVVFFVTLGMLLHPSVFIEQPVLLTCGLLAMLILKGVSAAIALRVTGLSGKAAFGMGLGLSQLGEFSFLLIAEGVRNELISNADYSRMLFIALGTLFLTPWLLRFGLRFTEPASVTVTHTLRHDIAVDSETRRAIVVGTGPVGRRVATLLETSGCEVCLIDLSPINLYPFAQQGFPTVAGDARDADVLNEAGLAYAGLLVVSVPDDEVARDVVQTARQQHPTVSILVRCRFESNVSSLQRAGANAIVSEETEAAERLKSLSENLLAWSPGQRADR